MTGSRVISRVGGLGRAAFAWLLVVMVAMVSIFGAPGQAAASTDRNPVALRGVEVLTDPTATLKLSDVQAATGWQRQRDTVVRGFTPQALWFRLEVDPMVTRGTWYLRVRPSYLDDVRAYLPGPDGQWEERRSGDATPADSHETSDPAIAFVWRPQAPLPSRYIYLRVHTTSIMAVNVALLDLDQYDRARDFHQLITGGLAGLMLGVMGWALYHTVRARGALFGLYLAYLVCSFGFSLGMLGYVARYLTPESTWADSFTSVMGVMATLTGTLFHRAFLRSFGHRLRLMWALEAGVLLSLVNLTLITLGITRMALMVNAYVVLLYTAFVLPAVVIALWPRVDRNDRLLLAMYSLVPASIALTIMPMLGLLPAGAWSAYTGSIYGLITAVAVAAVLAVRQRRRDEDAQASVAQAAAAQAEAAVVRAERDDKDRFLGMLAHELRTPLSVIRMVLDMGSDARGAAMDQRLQGHARQAVDDIDRVVERTVQADRLERGAMETQRSPCSVPEILGLVTASHLQGPRVQPQVAPGVQPVMSDPVLLRTMLSNLVDNALKYSPDDSTVVVQVLPRGEQGRDGVVVRVSNRVGRAGKPDAQRVFSKYYRSEGAQRAGGSGLGLYLIAGLARMVGGHVSLVEHTPPDEVVFELWLPK